MDEIYNQRRIVSIHQMLFEMARGNFNYRIPESNEKDEIETLVVLINMVAEEIKGSLFEFINTHSSQVYVTQSTLTLDANFMIRSITSEIILFLGYPESELIGLPLSTIISPTSLDQIHEIFDGGIRFPVMASIDFITKAHLFLTVSCSVSELIPPSEIILNFVTPLNPHSYYSTIDKAGHGTPLRTRKIDGLLIQQVHDYILANLESPLPSVQILARKFGTNEFKLKAGFRHFRNISIYKFYNEARLRNAYYMIEHTTKPLKSISILHGFNNYSNFSKSFKKRFGLSPYEVQRNGDGSVLQQKYPIVSFSNKLE